MKEQGQRMQPRTVTRPAILIAEDEPALLRLVSELLQQRGYEVITATDGQSALKAARRHEGPIGLLITDVMMPRLDGFDLQEQLLRERPGVPILVMSGALDEEITGEDFPIIRKPFTPEEFVAKVEGLLAV